MPITPAVPPVTPKEPVEPLLTDGMRLLSLGRFADRIGVQRATVYVWAKRDQIVTVRVGRRLMVPYSELERIWRGEF